MSYNTYLDLYRYYENEVSHSTIDVEKIGDLLLKNFNYMYDTSMGYAHILNPKNMGKAMIGTDYEDTLAHIDKYIDRFDNKNQKIQTKKEINDFFTDFHDLSEEAKDKFLKFEPKNYWAMTGNEKYPNLAKLARKIFSFPTS